MQKLAKAVQSTANGTHMQNSCTAVLIVFTLGDYMYCTSGHIHGIKFSG